MKQVRVEGTIGSRLLEAIRGSIYGLPSCGECAGGQHLNLLCMTDFESSVNCFLSSFKELLSEMTEVQHLSVDEWVFKGMQGSIDQLLIWLSIFKKPLMKGMERGLCTIAGSSSQFDYEDWVSSSHSEEGPWT